MRSIIQKMNREIFGFIHHLDFDPKRARPVTFWFYSDHELNIYRLAAHLQSNGYTIKCCEYSEISRNYLCIAEVVMSPRNQQLDRLCVDMQLLAEKMEVEFDGWETVIDPG
jgi:hypothetical protein